MVDEQGSDGDYSGESEPAETGCEIEQNQDDECLKVEQAGDAERGFYSESGGDRAEAGFAIKFEILTGVEDIEARCPHQYQQREQYRDFVTQRTADGDPCGGRRDREGDAQNDVGEGREAFGVGITEYEEQRDGRQRECQPI